MINDKSVGRCRRLCGCSGSETGANGGNAEWVFQGEADPSISTWTPCALGSFILTSRNHATQHFSTESATTPYRSLFYLILLSRLNYCDPDQQQSRAASHKAPVKFETPVAINLKGAPINSSITNVQRLGGHTRQQHLGLGEAALLMLVPQRRLGLPPSQMGHGAFPSLYSYS
jgi:hypothetical protein